MTPEVMVARRAGPGCIARERSASWPFGEACFGMRRWKWIAAALAVSAGSALAADDKDAKAPSGWAAVPTAEARLAARAEARKAGVFARAVARCAVADDGALTNCEVIRETPVGGSIGKALLALAPQYRRAPPKPGDPRQILITEGWYPSEQEPDWVRRPTADDLLAVYPTEAYRKGISGRAVISCIATSQGAVMDCVALEETPPGAGFGVAAIALTPQFLMKPATFRGAPVASLVNIPINFKTYGRGDTGTAHKVMPPNVAWVEAPTFAQLAAAYPKKAREERRGGRATLACHMSEAGRLKDCAVVTSDPRNYGFDAAAKQLSRLFAFQVTTEADRKATHDVIVQMPFTFDPATLDQGAPVVGKPSWAAIPSDAQMKATFADLKVTSVARTMLSCVVQPAGLLADCSVVSEEPAGAGVGAAALRLAPLFRVSTWTTEGLPVVGGTIRIPLRYEAGPASASAP